jgi:hypothetical protein
MIFSQQPQSKEAMEIWDKVASEINLPDQIKFLKLDFIKNEPLGIVPSKYPEFIIFPGKDKEVLTFENKEGDKAPKTSDLVKWVLDFIDESQEMTTDEL